MKDTERFTILMGYSLPVLKDNKTDLFSVWEDLETILINVEFLDENPQHIDEGIKEVTWITEGYLISNFFSPNLN